MTTLREAVEQAIETLQWGQQSGLSATAQGMAIKTLRAALATIASDCANSHQPQTTHSEECWRWHHACAVAEVERLRAALAQEALQDLAAADREIEAALEQPVRVADELPAAWQCAECGGTETLCPHGRRDVPLYAKPQPLTD